MVRKANQPLPLQVQKFLLDQTFTGTLCKITKHELTWEGWLRPSAVSYIYLIRLIYKLGSDPEIFLLEPDPFALADKVIPNRPLPHNYRGNPLRLCLFLPGNGEWKPIDPLAMTVIPWAVEWLWFFEDWVFTNVWSGGGIHPGPVEPGRTLGSTPHNPDRNHTSAKRSTGPDQDSSARGFRSAQLCRRSAAISRRRLPPLALRAGSAPPPLQHTQPPLQFPQTACHIQTRPILQHHRELPRPQRLHLSHPV